MRLLGIDVGECELRVAEAQRLFGAPRLTGVRRLPLAALSTLARTVLNQRDEVVQEGETDLVVERRPA